MAQYFMLECYGPDLEERAGIDAVQGDDGRNWMLGARFPSAPTEPIRITLDADQGLMMPMFNRGILVLHDDLLSALRAAGVDNLDAYDTDLFNPLTGKHFSDYKAVNIIGTIACADLGQSTYQSHGSAIADVDFDRLVLDPSRTRGALMFRLAECVSGIVVHEAVKRRVTARGIPHLDWVLPEEWVG